MAISIFVGNLPWRTTSDDLKALFEPFGAVENARIVTDRETGRSRGYGFVDMTNDEEAKKAVAELNGYAYGERPLTVNEAKAR
ncbi:MAG TPA: RNA-binding protein [Symbiobacteriaceae bacterium]|nr:RNA-binding protein [Symbiobacteriaceae bacterium]